VHILFMSERERKKKKKKEREAEKREKEKERERVRKRRVYPMAATHPCPLLWKCVVVVTCTSGV